MFLFRKKKFNNNYKKQRSLFAKKKRIFKQSLKIPMSLKNIFYISYLFKSLVVFSNSMGKSFIYYDFFLSNIFFPCFLTNTLMGFWSRLYNQINFNWQSLQKYSNLVKGVLTNSKHSWGSSYNSSLIILKNSYKTIIFRLPSGFIKLYNSNDCEPIIFNGYRLPKRYRRVRGIAKNPVDHPNGGSSKSRCPYFTPWGLIAKRGK